MMYVRIRPYNKRRGQLVRRYVYGGVRFEVNLGWYQVDDVIAEYLKTVLTHQGDPDSKLVFDVSDKAGAEKIAHEEYEAANPERKISEATAGVQKVTVADLKSPVGGNAPSPEPEQEDSKEETKTHVSGKSK